MAPDDLQSNFKLYAPHATDIWRKMPNTNRFDAPRRMQAPIPLSEFSSARVTFKGVWQHKYDQAGILLCFRGILPDPSDDADPAKNPWIKAGIEFFQDAPHISFVGCDRYADWSLHPVESGPSGDLAASSAGYVTIELRLQGDELGSAIWAYQLLLDGYGNIIEEFPIRECAWPFANGDCKVQVGAYVARPLDATASSNEELEVHFKELQLQRRNKMG